ncbi:uncharacterized protein LOC131677899 [Topomyia yanbarensis]|uniref:uncharacterized protein LOC131677899 n=1 Tax=Topomyia yanbarensis TaxID=2498891 RepID=UPI00273B0EE9|nr:uncharacterized protein LOC131677899 [Topomyia yanbarensis]
MGLLKTVAIIFTIGSITYAVRFYCIGRLYRSKKKFENRELIVVTGCTSGIGLAVVQSLAARQCHLVLGCRNLDNGNKVRQQLVEKLGNNLQVDIFHLDLSCLSSVAGFASKVNDLQHPIYALVNNAGIFYAPPALTVDKYEQTFQVNYLSHFLITILLLPKLKKCTTGSRIINLVSKAHQAVRYFPDLTFHKDFEDTPSNRYGAYQYSKFCLVLFAYKLSSILSGSSVSVHCVDPGNVETDIYRHFPQLSNRLLFFLQKPIRILVVKTPREGAQAVLYAILEEKTPQFYINQPYPFQYESFETNPRIYNPILSDTLWTLSRKLCGIYLSEIR